MIGLATAKAANTYADDGTGAGDGVSGEEAYGRQQPTGGKEMSNISELDLQNLRHLIGGFDTTHCKMQAYAKEAEDPQIRQFFEKGARSAMDNKEQLMKFLN